MIVETNVAENLSPSIAADTPRLLVDCNFCGSTNTHPYCPENERGLVQCEQCGLVYVGARPDPEALYTLYNEQYFSSDDSGSVGYSDYIADERNIRKTFERRLKVLEKYVAPGRLLDVGCAAGFFVSEAAQRGWDVQGLDVSEFAVNYVQEQFGFDAQLGSLLDLDYAPGTYDLVTMWDVIEHVPDPMAHMEKIATLLRPGGIFVLATPDVGSIPARLTGKRWIGYKMADEHIYYFSVKTLTQMLDKAGFAVVQHYPVGKYVTMSLFFDRLAFYLPFVEQVNNFLNRFFGLNEKAAYINPLDIVAITARKR
ncbi:methyltransferase domain-containing protein [Chloroflexota bacterium]